MDTCSDFVPPPEAPVFTPSDDEWKEPLDYISKIYSEAEKYGIIKIKPPAWWKPPFSVNQNTFTFVPRIQRLSELEIHSRVKLQFLDQLARFWSLQGVRLRIPNVERKMLNLHKLYTIVEKLGGFYKISAERRWVLVSERLGFETKHTGGVLKGHYEKILLPYHLFKTGDEPQEVKPEEIKEDSEESVKDDRKLRRSGREPGKKNDSSKSRLMGSGRKTGSNSSKASDDSETASNVSFDIKTETKRSITPSNVDSIHCQTCQAGDREDQMLLCEQCEQAYHIYCLIPPLSSVPHGDWRCPQCLAVEFANPTNEYGFEQSSQEYTLRSFGEKANDFKAEYFGMEPSKVPCSTVEKEFWRLLREADGGVVVEYGADVHAKEKGSGFPTKKCAPVVPGVEDYISSPWNLNNLPVLRQSILQHINGDVSGMKIPWCYVGMCFSCFCWHTEDHWTPSINYNHWGEPKTWYGVPGDAADEFEKIIKQGAPELFEKSPDLLHHITTTLNPNALMAADIPVYRTDQKAGEFVVTFPRSYHTGFNQGLNFAEAVNFCPVYWLPKGRQSVRHYREVERPCVFSHDELVCKMAAEARTLDMSLAAEVHKELAHIMDKETLVRKNLIELGIEDATRVAFEVLRDDERTCSLCKTTCFMSAVTCQCSPGKIACVDDVDRLCECKGSNKCLLYRYTLDELPVMLNDVKQRARTIEDWASRVKSLLVLKVDKKPTLSDLRVLEEEAEKENMPTCTLRTSLSEQVNEARRCHVVLQQLIATRRRTRAQQSGDSRFCQSKLNIDELKQFLNQVESLSCELPDIPKLKELVEKVTLFQCEAQSVLNASAPARSNRLKQLLDQAIQLDINMDETGLLKTASVQADWLEEVSCVLRDESCVTAQSVSRLISSGALIQPSEHTEASLRRLQELLVLIEKWENHARHLLQARPPPMLSSLEGLVKETSKIPAHMPNTEQVAQTVETANKWINKTNAIHTAAPYPYLEVIENLLSQGRALPVRLDQLSNLESQVSTAKAWKERTSRVFIKKTSGPVHTLLEVLCPRLDVTSAGTRRRRAKRDEEQNSLSQVFGDVVSKAEFPSQPGVIVSALHDARDQETQCFRALRVLNLEKVNRDDFVKYCVCNKPAAGLMNQCEICKDWFHGACVPKPLSSKPTNLQRPGLNESRFFCPGCVRSKRPRLDVILTLLVSLQKLSVRVQEGEALQCLAEKAMQWQERARKALRRQELVSHLQRLDQPAQDDQGLGRIPEMMLSADGSSPDHGYSTAPRASVPDFTETYRPGVGLVLEMSDVARSELEDLLMEGDLLEVTMTETSTLARLLASCQLHPPQQPKPGPSVQNKASESRSSETNKRKRDVSKVSGKVPTKKPKLKVKTAKPKAEENVVTPVADAVEDNDESCSAESCRNPTGDEVNWVQCDKCEEWYHLICIGFHTSDLPEEYMCGRCKPKDSTE